MKHFVIVNDWTLDYECGTTILGVAHTLEEAKEIFNKSLAEERESAEDNGWEIYEDSETVFDTGASGDYIHNHTNLYIQIV